MGARTSCLRTLSTRQAGLTRLSMHHMLTVTYRKSSYDKTELTIRILRADDPTPTPETYAKQLSQPQETQPTLITYGSRKVGGLRQSKRIRQVKDLGRRKKLVITPQTTVKELKMQVSPRSRCAPPGHVLMGRSQAASRARHPDNLATPILPGARATRQQDDARVARSPLA